MRRRAEARRPTHEALAAIDAAAQRIASPASSGDGLDPELASWFVSYHRNHRRRLAFDLDQIDGLIAGSEGPARPLRVLELGAVPLLLTVALAEREVELQAVDVAPERFAAAIECLDATSEGAPAEKVLTTWARQNRFAGSA